MPQIQATVLFADGFGRFTSFAFPEPGDVTITARVCEDEAPLTIIAHVFALLSVTLDPEEAACVGASVALTATLGGAGGDPAPVPDELSVSADPPEGFEILSRVKAARYSLYDHFFRDLDALERAYLGDLMQGRDPAAGLQAFLDKRTPTWEHQ